MSELSSALLFPGEEMELISQAPSLVSILDHLPVYIRDSIRPNVETVGLVQSPMVFVEGEWLHSGFRISDQGEVEVDGQVRKDAVVVQAGAYFADREIELGPGVVVESGAFIRGPSIIGRGTQVRQGAYIRGGCLIGAECVVGHATEVKNSIFLDGAKAGHFAYVGDSVLGVGVNLGAGTKLANLRFDGGVVVLAGRPTGRRKLGAFLGDGVQTGCNSVTNPGTVVLPGAWVPGGLAVGPGVVARG